MPRTSQTKPLA